MNILEQIKSCEQQAADIRAQAAMQARDMVRDADRKGADEAAVLLDETRQRCDERLQRADAESRQAAADFVAQQAEKDRALLKGISTKAAVEHVLEGILQL